jgi:uncharacterized RDD family membrane protein YckC
MSATHNNIQFVCQLHAISNHRNTTPSCNGSHGSGEISSQTCRINASLRPFSLKKCWLLGKNRRLPADSWHHQSVNMPARVPSAPFAGRVSSVIADLVAVAVITAVPIVIFEHAGLVTGITLDLVIAGLLIFIWSIYATVGMLRPGEPNGQTWGRQVGHTRVIARDGQLQTGQVLVRELPKALSAALVYVAGPLLGSFAFLAYIFLATYWLSAWRLPEHQAPHDLFCQTRVVDERYRVEDASGEII